jgi:hypothetical protein
LHFPCEKMKISHEFDEILNKFGKDLAFLYRVAYVFAEISSDSNAIYGH